MLHLLRAVLLHPEAEPFGAPSLPPDHAGLPALLCLTPALGDGYALGCSVEVTGCGVPTPFHPSHHLFLLLLYLITTLPNNT